MCWHMSRVLLCLLGQLEKLGVGLLLGQLLSRRRLLLRLLCLLLGLQACCLSRLGIFYRLQPVLLCLLNLLLLRQRSCTQRSINDAVTKHTW